MDYNNFGKKICLLRKQAALTQSALGAKINVSDKTVSKWENGYGLPDIATLPRLAQTLGVSVDSLLSDKTADAAAAAEQAPSSASYGRTQPASKQNNKQTHRPLFAGIKKEENIPSDCYRLNLYQVTHNSFTPMLILSYVFIIFFCLLFGAYSKTEYSDITANRYQTVSMSLLGSINTGYSVHVNDMPLSLLSIVTPAAMLCVVVLSFIQLVKTVNGSILYSIKLPSAIFALCLACLVYSTLTLPHLNYMEGRNVYFVSPGFIIVFALTGLQLLLCFAVQNHKKPKIRIRALFAGLCLIVAGLSLTAALLPPSKIDDSLIIYESENQIEVSIRTYSFDSFIGGQPVIRYNSTVEPFDVAIETNKQITWLNTVGGASNLTHGNASLDEEPVFYSHRLKIKEQYRSQNGKYITVISVYDISTGFDTLFDQAPASARIESINIWIDGTLKTIEIAGTVFYTT